MRYASVSPCPVHNQMVVQRKTVAIKEMFGIAEVDIFGSIAGTKLSFVAVMVGHLFVSTRESSVSGSNNESNGR